VSRDTPLMQQYQEIKARHTDAIAVPTFQGRRGHPVCVAGSFLPELRGVTEEAEGLRSIVRRHAPNIIEVPVARIWSGVSPLTVAWVPTGMKAGVSTGPCAVWSLPVAKSHPQPESARGPSPNQSCQKLCRTNWRRASAEFAQPRLGPNLYRYSD